MLWHGCTGGISFSYPTMNTRISDEFIAIPNLIHHLLLNDQLIIFIITLIPTFMEEEGVLSLIKSVRQYKKNITLNYLWKLKNGYMGIPCMGQQLIHHNMIPIAKEQGMCMYSPFQLLARPNSADWSLMCTCIKRVNYFTTMISNITLAPFKILYVL